MNKEELLKPIENVDKIETECIDINDTDKDTLISIVLQQRTTLENYEHKLNQQEEEHKKQIDDINNYYVNKIKELNALIKYHERKLNIIANVAMIENSLKEVEKHD